MVSGATELIQLLFLHHMVGKLIIHALADHLFVFKNSISRNIRPNQVLRTLFKESFSCTTAIDLHFLVFCQMYHIRAFNT